MISNETGASKQTAGSKLHTQNKENLVSMLFQHVGKVFNRGSSMKHQHVFTLIHSNRKVFHLSLGLVYTILGHIYGDILVFSNNFSPFLGLHSKKILRKSSWKMTQFITLDSLTTTPACSNGFSSTMSAALQSSNSHGSTLPVLIKMPP